MTVLTQISARATVGRATLIGGTAVLMWATLALLTTQAGTVPPFQLVAMAFAQAFFIGLAWPLARRRSPFAPLRQRPAVWLLGVGGLFGFHFLFFVAIRLAPPVEANLINYTWPLLIVLFSAFLPGERLRWWHVAGAVLGLAGAALLITKGGRIDLRAEHAAGYAAAIGSALIWSGYSVLSRRVGDVPTDAVGGFCGATALLALGCHLALEQTVWPDAAGWLAVLGLGLGPVGLAFFVWDHGVKKGDIRVLGAFAYAAPLLSTVLLISFGLGEPSWRVGAACLLIVGGAALAARDMFRRDG
ncbi:MAG TPA: DMT family transporter [Alphaproteobacteria bacterium]|nr:DMT family transporter [Alphaproteobacteria bacterium]